MYIRRNQPLLPTLNLAWRKAIGGHIFPGRCTAACWASKLLPKPIEVKAKRPNIFAYTFS